MDVSLTLSELQMAQFPVTPPGRPSFGPIETGDCYVNLSIASERTFQSLAAACGRTDWISDPRFAKYPDRRANWGTLIDELEVWSRTRSSAEVQAIFDRHGVPASPYRTVREALDDPQMRACGALVPFADGHGLTVMTPFHIDGVEKVPAERAPAVGQHNDTVLRDAGYTSDEIEQLRGLGLLG